MIHLTTGAGYCESHPMHEGPTAQQALDTFHRTVKDEDYNNWPEWIKRIQRAIETGKAESLVKSGEPWMMEVFERIKNEEE